MEAGGIVGNGLSEFKKPAKELLAVAEGDFQASGGQADAGGGERFEGGRAGGRGDGEVPGLFGGAEAGEFIAHAAVAALFHQHVIAVGEGLQFGAQFGAADYQGLSGLVAGELVEDAQRLARADAEQDFDGLAVQRGGGELAEAFERFGQTVDPLGAARHACPG